MPVDSQHSDYLANAPFWRRCRDAFDGEDAIKAAGETYLPRLGGQDEDEYKAYLKRALYYNATGRTIEGLTGFVFRKDPEVSVDAAVEQDLDDITLTGVSLWSFCKQALSEILITGRYGVLVDMPEKPATRPLLASYQTEDIINWDVTQKGGQTVLSLVVLSETAQEANPADPFVKDSIAQLRVLRLDEQGFYRVDLWRMSEKDDGTSAWTIFRTIEPRRFDRRLDFIPFRFLGPKASGPEVQKPPMLDLVEVNLSHYRSSADLEHGRHFTALPTPWVVGFPEDTQLKIGSAIAWVSSNTEAKAGMLEFTGQGLGALERALEEKERKMAALGARMLEEQKRASEAAETVRLRTSGEQSYLQSLANSVSASMTDVLNWYSEWRGASATAVIKLNTDYESKVMTGQDLRELVATWMAGGMAWETLYANLQAGELTRPGVTAEEEKALIMAEMPVPRLDAITPIGKQPTAAVKASEAAAQDNVAPAPGPQNSTGTASTASVPDALFDVAGATRESGNGGKSSQDLADLEAQVKEVLSATEETTNRIASLESLIASLRALIESKPAAPVPDDEFRHAIEARLEDLGRQMAAERGAIETLIRREPQPAPVVNATIVVPKNENTPLVRTVERNADGLITRITDRPAPEANR